MIMYVDASFAGDLRDSKSTSGGLLCVVGPNTFAPINWFCKKQGAVSHSSSEAEVIALDTGVRIEVCPALTLWEQVLDVFDPVPVKPKPGATRKVHDIYSVLAQVDYVEPSLPEPSGRAKCLILEDNDAVIKMTVKQRSPNMRHVVRTHRVDFDSLWERFNNDPGIALRYVVTNDQLSDMLTKGHCAAQQWMHLMTLLQMCVTKRNISIPVPIRIVSKALSQN